MHADLSTLVPDLRDKMRLVIDACEKRGFVLRPFFCVRSPLEQAKLWRQSRPLDEIERTIKKIREEGAAYLARTLERAGPSFGRWATNSLPGPSWHQWGEAVDCFALGEQGRAVWSTRYVGYEIYADEARKQNLNAGYFWQRQDAVHVQLRTQGVRSLYTWPQIDRTMWERFGDGDD